MLLLLLGGARTVANSPPTFTFTANISDVSTLVDRTLVGATLEDTSFSEYGGGLYSQLIFGESFEEARLEGLANHLT